MFYFSYYFFISLVFFSNNLIIKASSQSPLILQTTFNRTISLTGAIAEMLYSSMFRSFSTIGSSMEKIRRQTLEACRKKNYGVKKKLKKD